MTEANWSSVLSSPRVVARTAKRLRFQERQARLCGDLDGADFIRQAADALRPGEPVPPCCAPTHAPGIARAQVAVLLVILRDVLDELDYDGAVP